MRMNQISPAEFVASTKVRFTEIGYTGANITEIVINDGQSGSCFAAFPIPGQDIYIKDKNELLIDFEGVFYRAVRKE